MRVRAREVVSRRLGGAGGGDKSRLSGNLQLYFGATSDSRRQVTNGEFKQGSTLVTEQLTDFTDTRQAFSGPTHSSLQQNQNQRYIKSQTQPFHLSGPSSSQLQPVLQSTLRIPLEPILSLLACRAILARLTV